MKILVIKFCLLLLFCIPVLADILSAQDCEDFKKLTRNGALMSAMNQWAHTEILGKPIRRNNMYRFGTGYRFLKGAPSFFSESPLFLHSSIYVINKKGRNIESFLLGTRFGVGFLFSDKNINLLLNGNNESFAVDENKVISKKMAYQCRIW